MTNVVYLVGNGFDLNLTAKTSAFDICSKFIDNYPDNLFSKYLRALRDAGGPGSSDKKSPLVNWTDYEVAIGEFLWHSGVDTDLEAKYDAIDFFVSEVLNYLNDENMRVVSEIRNGFNREGFLDGFITPRPLAFRRDIQELVASNALNGVESRLIAVFNFTDIFGTVFSYCDHYRHWQNVEIVYPHGRFSNSPEDHPIIGAPSGSVLNPKQDDVFFLKDCIRGRHSAPDTSRLFEAISSANMIIIYGMSLGKSDHEWWKAVLERLLADEECLLAIGFHVEDDSNTTLYSHDSYLRRYATKAIDELLKTAKLKLDRAQRENLSKQIIFLQDKHLIPRMA